MRISLPATARFLGLNIRAGYRLPVVRESWQVTLMGGYYFTTSLVNPPTFGYRNVGGPQLYPTVRRAFRNGDFASGYLKFSPIANSVNPCSVYLDASQIQLDLPGIEFQASTSSITLGASNGF